MNINVCDVLIKTTRRPRVYTRGFDTDLGLRLSINKFVLKLLIRTLLQYYVDIELLCGTDYINEYVDHRMTINRLCFLNTTLCCYCFFFFSVYEIHQCPSNRSVHTNGMPVNTVWRLLISTPITWPVLDRF